MGGQIADILRKYDQQGGSTPAIFTACYVRRKGRCLQYIYSMLRTTKGEVCLQDIYGVLRRNGRYVYSIFTACYARRKGRYVYRISTVCYDERGGMFTGYLRCVTTKGRCRNDICSILCSMRRNEIHDVFYTIDERKVRGDKIKGSYQAVSMELQIVQWFIGSFFLASYRRRSKARGWRC